MSETGSESERSAVSAPVGGIAQICLHGPLRKLAGGEAEYAVQGSTVVELLRALEERHPDLHGWILDERGRIRRHINVFVGASKVKSGPR